MIIPYQTKQSKLLGTRYAEILTAGRRVFGDVKKQTKRQPYVRSAYFKKEKIFLTYFWNHLFQKPPKERVLRLQYMKAALDVIRYSRNQPLASPNRHKPREILYRFAGLTKEGELFYIQIKEDKKTGRKYFMSCFPQR